MITLLRRVVSSLQTIRVRLTLWYVALLTIVLIPFSAGLYIVLQHEVTTSNDAALHFSAQHVIDSLNSNGGAGALGRAVAGLPIGTVVVLYNRFGERIEASTRSTLPQLPVPQPPNGSPAPIYQTVHLSNGDQWRVLTTPLFLNGTLAGLLQVAESEAQSQSALRELALLLAIAVPVTLIIASAGGVFLAGRALRPISKMTQTVRTMRPQDLSQRIPVPATADEVHQLAETFNALLQRLEQSFERERQFTADVSHELRTPLSILRTQVDLALERGPSDAGAALEAMRTDIEHLQRLVSDLLLLARAEHGEAIGQHEPLRLDNLITDTVETLRPLAEAHGLHLDITATTQATVIGDQTNLTQLLINLLDNAIKYTPAQGLVSVSLTTDASHAVLRVSDTGPGIAPEHLPHLFDRFYRVRNPQSRQANGTGLGLAIVRWIVESHGGAISVESSLETGTTFTVLLPLATIGPLPSS